MLYLKPTWMKAVYLVRNMYIHCVLVSLELLILLYAKEQFYIGNKLISSYAMPVGTHIMTHSISELHHCHSNSFLGTMCSWLHCDS